MRIPIAKIPEDTQNTQAPFGVHLISLIAGLVLAIMGWKSLMHEYPLLHKLTHLNQEYRPAPARMIQVKARRDTTESGDRYYPDVLFEYFVAGRSIWGWRFSYEEEPRRKSYWERRLTRYHPGDSVTAYVNFADPRDSFIERRTDGLLRSLLKTLVACAFMLFGALLLAIPAATFLGNLLRVNSKKAARSPPPQ